MSKSHRKYIVHGTPLTIDVAGVEVRYEGTSGQKLRLKLVEGRLFDGDPQDLNLYRLDEVQLHRTNRIPQRGTGESQRFGLRVACIPDVSSVQVVGTRTVVIYIETLNKARARIACELVAALMLEQSTASVSNP